MKAELQSMKGALERQATSLQFQANSTAAPGAMAHIKTQVAWRGRSDVVNMNETTSPGDLRNATTPGDVLKLLRPHLRKLVVAADQDDVIGHSTLTPWPDRRAGCAPVYQLRIDKPLPQKIVSVEHVLLRTICSPVGVVAGKAPHRPVLLASPEQVPTPDPPPADGKGGSIEIMLPNGARVSVDAFVNEKALSRVLRAMKGLA